MVELPYKSGEWDVPSCAGRDGNIGTISESLGTFLEDTSSSHQVCGFTTSTHNTGRSDGRWRSIRRFQELVPMYLLSSHRKPDLQKGSPLSSIRSLGIWGCHTGWDEDSKTGWWLYTTMNHTHTKNTTQGSIPGPQGRSGQQQCQVRKVDAALSTQYHFLPCLREGNPAVNRLIVADSFQFLFFFYCHSQCLQETGSALQAVERPAFRSWT